MRPLAGWFGGHGLAGAGQWIESLGLRPRRMWAVPAGALEPLGGLFFGLFNPPGAAFIGAIRLAAIVRAHWPKGL